MSFQGTAVGSMNFDVFSAILKKGSVIRIGRGAEIGVLYGDTSDHLLRTFPELTLYSIDPYLGYEAYEKERTQEAMTHFEAVATQKLALFGDRSIRLKMTSLEAAPLIDDESLDFVFIDALHSYEAVRDDLNAWVPKVRNDGIIAGHDYRWDGVQKAVHEFTDQRGISGFFTPETSDIWFFIKSS